LRVVRYSRFTAVNRGFERPTIVAGLESRDRCRACRIRRDGHSQAQVIVYIDDFKLMMIMTVAAIPLLIAFKKKPGDVERHTLLVE
jgi:MFS transporter, DHA2 family, multidrug resistance protein